jgi:hypothetical protein
MITTPDKYPLPNMQDLSNGLDGCSVFSKVDLVKGYHQIPVAPEDIPKTPIITPFGLFEYLFTPFGLSNAAQTFQRMIDLTCADLEGTFPYMDDNRVGSPDRKTHLHHLDKLFSALAVNGLAIEKCVFAVPTLEFLGHRISAARTLSLFFAPGTKRSRTAAATMPILDVLAAGAAWSLAAASSAMWTRAAADLVATAPAKVLVFFTMAILLG